MSSEDPERQLEELLRRLPRESAREAPDARRRAEARRAFLAAGEPRSRPDFGARMGSVTTSEADESDGFVAWLAARAPAAAPAPGARRHARLAFLSALASAPPLRRTRRSFRATVLVLAAAAILAVTFLLPEPERWRVELGGPLRFAEVEYAPDQNARLAAALEGSGLAETGGERARFTLGGLLDVELLAGSRLLFPPLPELDGQAPIAFELQLGEAYVRTREGYPGNPIIVRTAEGDVALHGTTVGVLVDEIGTCVCVAEGTALVMGPRLSGGQELTQRFSLRLYRDAQLEPHAEPFAAEGVTPHTQQLVDFLGAP